MYFHTSQGAYNAFPYGKEDTLPACVQLFYTHMEILYIHE